MYLQDILILEVQFELAYTEDLNKLNSLWCNQLQQMPDTRIAMALFCPAIQADQP